MAGADPKGYKNFGSFFTDNVQEMICTPASKWTGPEVPDMVADARTAAKFPERLGREMRSQFFIDFDEFTFVNHGAFGGCLKQCYAEVRAWQEHCESQPLRFLDRQLFPHMVDLLRNMADFVNCDAQDLAFVPNATTGLNTVLAHLDLHSGSEVVMLDIGYGALKKIAGSACEERRATVVQVPVSLPISCVEDIETPLIEAITSRTQLLILDSVTSNTAIALPTERLIKACRARNPDIRVLIDGAHALGQLPVSLRDSSADYFVSNCHKWLCAPRGSAILWVRRPLQASLQPLIKSHGHGCGFTSDFIWDGCRDYAPYLAVAAALAWWRTAPADRVRRYMSTLLAEAVELLTGVWSSGVLAPLSLCASMACVRLPDALQVEEGASSAHAKELQDDLYRRNVEVPVKCLHGCLYVRISVHVYNEIGDYEELARAVSDSMAARA